MATVKKNTKKEAKTVAEPKANNIEEIKKALENVDTTIPEPKTEEEPVKAENDELAKSEAHIEEMSKEMEDLQTRQQTLQEELEKNPDNAEELLKTELAKAKEVYKKITYNDAYYTNTWNGQRCY